VIIIFFLFLQVSESPDLTVKSDDILLLPPYPYLSSGDEIPIQAEVYNIGGETAYNVDVNFTVALGTDSIIGIIYSNTITFDEIKPRCSVDTTVYWNTGLTHPDYYGEIGDCEFIVTVDPDSEITESWEYNNTSSITKKVVLYPYESGWPKKIFNTVHTPQPAIANLDASVSIEIVCPGDDSIYVFNYDGSIFVDWPQYFPGVYGVVLGDIDDNGYIEIVAVSPDSIKVYNYQGTIMWQAEVPVDNYIFIDLPAVGYIDDMHLPEIVILAPSIVGPEIFIKIFVYSHGGILQHEFTSSQSLQIAYEIEPILLNGASICDVISGGNGEIVFSYGKEPSEFYTEIFDNTGSVAVFDYGSSRMTSALVDLDNDGYAEVITGGSDKKIRAYKATTGQILWERETEGKINSSPAVGDIHPVEYGVEITFGNDARRVHLREKVLGHSIDPWPYVIDTSTKVNTSPAIANINGDKYLDVIVGANNQYIYALNYDKTTISPFPLPLFGKPSSPIIGDIDGDRKSEIILASDNGYLHVWENMDSKVLPYSLEWPQFHHDYQRTGLYGWVGGLRGGDANPKTFSTGTTLSFSLKKALHTKIKIFDAEANLVKTLVNQTLPQGTYNPVWFGKDENYAFLPNGIYFIEIKVKNESKIIPVQINR